MKTFPNKEVKEKIVNYMFSSEESGKVGELTIELCHLLFADKLDTNLGAAVIGIFSRTKGQMVQIILEQLKVLFECQQLQRKENEDRDPS